MSGTTPTDEQLALGIQAGKEADLMLLIERHYNPLLGYLYRFFGGNRELAEDVTQDVIVQATGAIHQYQYPRPFKPWLYAIATNMARNQLKRAETQRTVTVTDSFLEQIEWDEAPDDALTQDENERYVAQILALLAAHQREVILLRYYEDLSLDEIAAALRIPPGTVKSRLSLALKQLRAIAQLEPR